MKNKGFTLIELLAVIVILAIIALIATPVILGIIENSRNEAKARSAELAISGVETAYATAYLKDHGASGTASGVPPTLTEVDAAFSVNNADATISGTSLVVTTTDGVTCTFTVTNGHLKIATSGCGAAYTLKAEKDLGAIKIQ